MKPVFIRRFVNILLLSFLVSLIPLIAYASATLINPTGPVWTNPGYRFTIDVTQISNPDSGVCLLYSVNGGSSTKSACTCTSPACAPATKLGTWVCTIPTNYNNSTISWDMSTYSGNCGSQKTFGASGTFSTGPTALRLVSFEAINTSGTFVHKVLPLVGALLAMGFLAILFYFRTVHGPGPNNHN